jgi:hypothetical protein
MTDQELRALVRDAIARHLSGGSGAAQPTHDDVAMPASFLRQHASHGLLTLGGGPDGADSDGACIIEPAVRCDGCGYCKSMGH